MELAIANNTTATTTTTTTRRTVPLLTSSSSNKNNNNNNNTSNQSNPRKQSNNLSHSLVVSNGDGDVDSMRSPFQREVREWQRIDPTTGALLTGRLEADRWINGPLNSYGKISDSQNIAQPNGTRLSQRKQLEVLQQRTASGAAVQVIRAQTVQSSSSRWTSSSSSPSAAISSRTTTKTKTKSNNNNRNSLSNGSLHNKNNNNIVLNTSSRLQPLAPIILDYSPAATTTTTTTMKQRDNFNNTHNINDNNNDDDNHCDDDVCVVVVDNNSASNDSTASDYEKRLINDHGNYLNQEKSKEHDKSTGNNNKIKSKNIINSNNNNNTKNISGNTSIISSNLSNFLLLDTAPSLKLSNLMKSSSSISSNSNSSYANGAAAAASTATTNTTTTTTTNMLTFSRNNNNNHCSNTKSEVKTNLHANLVVGNTAAAALSTSTSSASMTVTPTNTFWQQRKQQQQEQQQTNPRNSRLYDHQHHPTYDKISATNCGNFAKSRVGGSSSHNVVDNDDCNDNDDGDNDVAEFGGRTGFLNATDERSTLQVTPTHLHRQQRRDLESFRLSNENHHDDHYKYDDDDDDDDNNDTKHFCDGNDVAADASAAVDLRFSPHHQQHQLTPNSSPSFLDLSLQRGRSISTDDLSTEWDSNVENKELDEPSEWRRVSKLRRSFQSAATTTRETTNQASQTTATPRRPLDLPKSSVSVSKIRAELENGRRLTTAMRGNHVDLAALQSILDTPTYPKPSPVRRTAFLTAESLKEIRGKLKKLSDESLYKEDFMAHQLPPTKLKQITDVRDVKTNSAQQRQLTPERSSALNTTTRSAFTVVSPQKLSAVDYNSTQKPHTTNSLESRQKCRDISSAEWHLRRKSYGFEKMSPPANSSMFRMDASTDSGLGRSGELATWSPTETVPASSRGTIIHFGEAVRMTPSGGLLQRRTHQQKLNSSLDVESIAVDESQNVRKTSQVHLNGFGNHSPDSSAHQQLANYDTDSPLNASSSQQHYQRTQHKRVEFCKTEVHFAAESGRVNIVETDGKPPPTNNFRRRRRTTSGPLQSLVKGDSLDSAAAPTLSSNTIVAIPITRFGDDSKGSTITTSSTVPHKASLMDTLELMETPVGVTVSLTKGVKETYNAGSRSSYASTTSGIDTTDNENDDVAGIRGILKNKPIKPKPYHLGENIDSSDSLWGVHLKTGGRLSPIRGEAISSVKSPNPDASPSLALNKTVAERVRSVEKLQDSITLNQTNGYSTKINLNLSDTTSDWKERELPKSNVMNIELHSPQQPPVAKPRLLAPAKQHNDKNSKGEAKEPLRIIKEARGARKLREHELSYFGVPVTKAEPTKLATSNYKRTLPNRSRLTDETTKSPADNERYETQYSKWSLKDSPEFLHHSPKLVEPQLINKSAHIKSTERQHSRTQESVALKKSFDPVKRVLYSDEEEDGAEPFYENITNEISSVIKVKPPPHRTDVQAYSRKRDLKRDERILSEMTHNADQTMKALSDEATLKDQHRRSITRRSSKPLETINEKSTTEKLNDSGVSVKFTRSTVSSEAKRQNVLRMSPSPTTMGRRASTSSQSSVESYSRARSRSLSSEREYENIKEMPATTTKHMRHTKPSIRSNSLEHSQRSSHPHGGSSGDEHYRHEERLRAKTKRLSSSGGLSKAKEQEGPRHVKEIERKERDARSLRVSTAHKEKSARTTRFSQRERIECAAEAANSPQCSPSSRRYKSDAEKRSSSSRLSAAGKPEVRSSGRLLGSTRSSHDHDSTQRSSKRSDRSETEKEKLSRSKGRPSTHSSDHNHQHHHQHPSSFAPKVRHTPSSEVRKSSSATDTAADATQTHSKNAHSLNGVSMSRSHHEEEQPGQQQHIHRLTTTVTGKHSIRFGKDRK